jgi:hypothetical protein
MQELDSARSGSPQLASNGARSAAWTILRDRLCALYLALRPNAAPFLLLALVTAAIAFIYIKNERFFYFWDYALYQDLTERTAAAFHTSFTNGVSYVWSSLAYDYNCLFTLPLVPITLELGTSRPVFIVGLAIFYQLPLSLAVGAVAAELFRGSRRSIFWGTALLTLLVPTIWVPTLWGYPDAGGAACILLAVSLYLRNARRGRSMWRAAPIGVALACGMMFRRHYMYAAMAFFAAAAIHEAALVSAGGSMESSFNRGRVFWKAALKLTVIGAATVGTLLIVGEPFVKHVLAHNYYELYRSYLFPPFAEFRLFRDLFGSGIWLSSLCGWILAWRSRAVSRAPASFVLLFGCLSLLLWIFVVRQLGLQYAFHVMILVVLGMAALGVLASELVGGVGAGRVTLWLAAAALVGLNFFLAFSSRHALAHMPARRLFAANYPPRVRSDYDEILRLLDYLHSVAGPETAVFVGGSSEVMNYDILARAERAHRQPGQPALPFLETPQVDSRDWYPLEELLRARFVIITTPFQHHLAPSQQDVVRVVDAAFTEGWEIAGDFLPLPVWFHLADRAEATVFRRLRPTSPARALRTFDEERRFLAPRSPGTQPDWIGLTPDVETIHQPPEARRIRFAPAATRQILLYVGTADWHGKRFTASVHFGTPLAAPVRLTLTAADAAGNRRSELASTAQVVRPGPASAEGLVSMQTPLPDPNCPRLLLTIEPQEGASLPSEITDLSLSSSP